MSTVPQDPDEVRASDLEPGSVMWDQDLCRVRDVVPFTDGDGRPRVSVVLVPLLADGPVHVVEFLADNVLYLASEAEIAEHRNGERRREFVAGLRELADLYEAHPTMPMPSNPDFMHCVSGDDDDAGRAEVAFIAGHLDVPPRDDCHVERYFGPLRYRAFYNLRSEMEQYNADLALLKSVKSSAEVSSPSVDSAEGGTDPAAPSGPGAGAAPGPDTPMADCRETATQRIQAYFPETDGTYGAVYTCDAHRGEVIAALPEIGLRGRTHGAVSGEPCGLQHNHANPGAPLLAGPDKTAAGEAGDTTAPADATATDPGDRVDGPPSGPVRAAAVPVAPPGEVGATGITPHRTPRGYDPMPTCIFATSARRNEFHAGYARDLDRTHPGWHWDDTQWMSSELRDEAMTRRRADGMERPYKCEGCGKTSRITPHRPGCRVDAAWLARNKQNGADQ